MTNKNLGRGLSAFLDTQNISNFNSTEKIIMLNLTNIEVNPYQPRKFFKKEELNDLAESIKEKGVLQPVIVRLVNDKYQLIAGERRFRASQIAMKSSIPAIIIQADDIEAAEFSLLENLQRENLTVVEEAEAYQKLIENFGHTQEAIAKSLGKSRSHVANVLRLNHLSDQIKQYLNDGLISFGHAKVIIGCGGEVDKIVEYIVANGLSVRQTELYMQSLREKDTEKNEKIGGKTGEKIDGKFYDEKEVWIERIDEVSKDEKDEKDEKENKIIDNLIDDEKIDKKKIDDVKDDNGDSKNSSNEKFLNNKLDHIGNEFCSKRDGKVDNKFGGKCHSDNKRDNKITQQSEYSELTLIEAQLSKRIGLPVNIKTNKNGGIIEIKFDSVIELDSLLQRLTSIQ